MADRLTAAQMAELSQRNIRVQITRMATLTNNSGSWGLSDTQIKGWGKSKFEVYNKHPNDRGRLRFPTFSLTADNSDGDWDLGGKYFPNGRSDLFSSTMRLQIVTSFSDGTFFNNLDFYGQLKEPEYDETGVVTLIVEHPLTSLTGRKWDRTDRIGGDTGINSDFNAP